MIKLTDFQLGKAYGIHDAQRGRAPRMLIENPMAYDEGYNVGYILVKMHLPTPPMLLQWSAPENKQILVCGNCFTEQSGYFSGSNDKLRTLANKLQLPSDYFWRYSGVTTPTIYACQCCDIDYSKLL